MDFPRSGLILRTALRADDRGWAGSVDVASRESGWIGITSDGRARSARLGIRLRGSGWRAGLDASTTDAPLRYGEDPLTGHRLDRPHRCVQAHGRLRGAGWSVGALWRDLVRGEADPVSTLELEAVWRAPARGWVDELSARIRAVPDQRVTLVATRVSGRARLRLRFARSSAGISRSELVGAELRLRAGRQELRLAAAGVDGNASRPWLLSRPGTGIYPVWIRPAGVLLAGGWGVRSGPLSAGAWIWLRADAGREPGPGFGFLCSVAAGEVVRRLQGSALSRTGAPSGRFREARPRRSQP
jgi:hypothetical protein